MQTRIKLVSLLAWLQILVSIFLASAIIWGYATYQASLGQFIHSIAASIGAISNAVAKTAETVEANRYLLNQSAQTLIDTRKLITELRVEAEIQAKAAPQYAESVRTMASITRQLGDLLQATSDGPMMFSAPSDIQWQGMKPVVVMSRPMEVQARNAKEIALTMKNVSDRMLTIAAFIGSNGPNIAAAIISTSEQALKELSEAEKALRRINAQDLPKAIEDLKVTSQNLSAVSAQVDMVSNVGLVLLGAGLLIAVWCFLNSLGLLMLANSREPQTV